MAWLSVDMFPSSRPVKDVANHHDTVQVLCVVADVLASPLPWLELEAPPPPAAGFTHLIDSRWMLLLQPGDGT